MGLGFAFDLDPIISLITEAAKSQHLYSKLIFRGRLLSVGLEPVILGSLIQSAKTVANLGQEI